VRGGGYLEELNLGSRLYCMGRREEERRKKRCGQTVMQTRTSASLAPNTITEGVRMAGTLLSTWIIRSDPMWTLRMSTMEVWFHTNRVSGRLTPFTWV
jgi:hypothetical protein